MRHRLLLVVLALLGCERGAVASESLSGLAADYQVDLGFAMSFNIQRPNPNVRICPVFMVGNEVDYEPALKRFHEEVAGLVQERNVWRAALLLAPLQTPESATSGLVPVGWAGPFGLWAAGGTPADDVREMQRSLLALNGAKLGGGVLPVLVLSSGDASAMLEKARAARAVAPSANASVRVAAAPEPPNPNFTDPPISLQPPPPKHFDFGQGPTPQGGIDSWTLPPPPRPPAKPPETEAQRRRRLQALKAEQKQKADLEKEKSIARSLQERKAVDDLNRQQEERKAKVRKSWQDRADYVNSQVKRPDAITFGPVWSEPSELDGPGKWIHITLINNTDITFSLDMYYFGGPQGDQGDQWKPVTSVYPGKNDVTLFATGGKPWVARDFRGKWQADGYEYSVNVLPN